MPDVEIEALAGDGLEPTVEFVASLRSSMQGEWRGDVVTALRRPWRPWAGAAAAVLLVLAVAALASRRHDTDSIVSTVTTVALSTAVPKSVTEGLPTTVMGQLWVVTSVEGVPLDGPDLPTFTAHGDGTISGWDGCNSYTLEPGRSGSSVAPCAEGVLPVVKAIGPFTMTSGADLTTATFTAEMFDRQDHEAPAFVRTYRFGDLGAITFFDEGVVGIDGGGCSFASVGTWTEEHGVLRLGLARPECGYGDTSDASNAFRQWLAIAGGAGVPFSFHFDAAGGLWTQTDGRVSRLVPDLTVPNIVGTWAFGEHSSITLEAGGAGSTSIGGCAGSIGYHIQSAVLTITPGHSALCTAANSDPAFEAWLTAMTDTGGVVAVVDGGRVLEVRTPEGQVTRLISRGT